ncbi:uncharacterized protein CTRU02_204788 [Colletotrichum truncatum]|uniref:Uncharacterized protein n=1 Tax=Colletotrichum truncatum TaxID=5467 RepID=A0ACC3ZD31_COLTU|nr:uncharacterized protein CTRU02_03022 [Colletotrichum truncatum]KAF6797980.1 hypothetical protein CTRU02_03022 [Colletotrichum truncatum]
MDANKFSRNSVNRYAAEIRGASSDRPMRPVMEQITRQFLRAIEEMNMKEALSFFAPPTPRVIASLRTPGFIFEGGMELDSFFKDFHDFKKNEFVWKDRIVPHFIIVDRSRITCHTVTFRMQRIEEKKPDGTFEEIHHIIVIDYNERSLFNRLEYREITGKNKTHKGGKKLMENLVIEADTDFITVDHTS